MREREEFYKDIDIFSLGATGFSPYIIDIMRKIEREFGGVDQDFLDYISKKFKTTEQELIETAKMIGIKLKGLKNSKEIRVCVGSNCKADGSEFVLEEFKKILKIDVNETTEDGEFTLTLQNCFSKCGEGPNVKIGENFYSGVEVESVAELIELNRK